MSFFQKMSRAFTDIKTCPYCKCDDETKLKPMTLDLGHSMTWCEACEQPIGSDDTMSPEDANDLLRIVNFRECSCGNDDFDEFIQDERDGQTVYRCLGCEKVHEIDQVFGGDVKSDTEKPEIESKLTCKCGNDKSNKFEVYSTNGTTLGIQCQKCTEVVYTQGETDFPPVVETTDNTPENVVAKRQISRDDARAARIRGKRDIKHARDLQQGAHIAWWRPEQYWHHALVREVHVHSNCITVIHYNGPSPGGIKLKGIIVDEKIDLSKEKGILYEMVYEGDCLPADMAIIRAATRIGESSYNFFTNNCEHFVRWAKTDAEICEQVNDAVDFIKGHVKKIQELFMQSPLKSDMMKGVGSTADMLLKDAGATVGKIIPKSADIAGPIAIVGIEAAQWKRQIADAQADHAAGRISKAEFQNVYIRCTAQCVLRGTGEIIGSFVVPQFVPVPKMVGFTLGAILGHVLGSLIGFGFASLNRGRSIKPRGKSLKGRRRRAIKS